MLETRRSTKSNDIHQSFLTIYHINDTDEDALFAAQRNRSIRIQIRILPYFMLI